MNFCDPHTHILGPKHVYGPNLHGGDLSTGPTWGRDEDTKEAQKGKERNQTVTNWLFAPSPD